MSNPTSSIQQPQELGLDLRMRAKYCLGRWAAAMAPRRALEMYANPVPSAAGFLDRFILFHLRQRSLREDRKKFFERLHRNFWSGERVDAVGEPEADLPNTPMGRQFGDFEILKREWTSMVAQHIVEFGTDTGMLLDFLTKNLIAVKSSVGLDFNEERNCQTSEELDPRIDFVRADGSQCVFKHAQPYSLFVSGSGVLKYFSRESLDEMLLHISARCRPAIFYAREPVARGHNFAKTRASIPFGDELLLSHNYTHLFETNGFEIVHQRSDQQEQCRLLTTIAVIKN